MFTIWMIGKMLRWVEARGGLEAMEAAARAKATLLYDAIDSSDGFYLSPVELACRSLMNVVFRLSSDELTSRFLAAAKEAGFVGLKGHRSVGGIRASIYNAMPVDGAQALADLMAEFRAANA
jgi:phosphoserine aminotransferase